MVEEAAQALVPGPGRDDRAGHVLVVTDPELLAALAAGERIAGLALEGDVRFDGQVTGVGHVAVRARRRDGGLLLVPADGEWLLVDAAGDGVRSSRLRRRTSPGPLARVVLTSAPAT